MKKLRESLGAKIVFGVLAVLCFAVLCVSSLGLFVAAEENYYNENVYGYGDTPSFEDDAFSMGYSIAAQHLNDYEGMSFEEYTSIYDNWYIRMTVEDAEGKVIYTNCGNDFSQYGEELLHIVPMTVLHSVKRTDSWGQVYYEETLEQEPEEFTLRYCFDPAGEGLEHDGYRLFRFLFPLRYWCIGLSIGSLVLGVVLTILLCCMVGYKKDHEGIYLNAFHRIPLDVLLAAVAGLELLGIYIADLRFEPESMAILLGTAILLLCMGGLLFAAFLSVVVRLKAGKWWKNTVIYRILRLLWRGLCAVGRGIRAFFRAIPMLWKTLLGITGISVALVLLLALANGGADGLSMTLFALLYLMLSAGACIVTLQLIRLKKAGEKLAQGDLSHQTNLKGLFWEFRQHAAHLNAVAEGMSIAVEQRMKSERMKTELITNVSHDIKTPLTSIINYVDLLKKPHTEEQGREYLDVLDRQSQRLKKMTEDLVEASKASTGNINVNFEKTDIGELMRQAASEYADRFGMRELQPVLKISGEPLCIMADGKLLWRVMENLLGNVCKYAQSGTRIYLTAEEREDRVRLTVKNISAVMLDVAPDELMERFVRGDASRNAEGSGLGLSIARSLTELQGGAFRIEIDGDLFKAEMSFPIHQK